MRRTRAIFRRRLQQLKRLAPKLRVGLVVGDPEDFPKQRNFAMCGLARRQFAEIIVAPKIENEPDEVIDALLRHELAHALLLYQGHSEHYEREADEVAEMIWGERINYDARDVETLGPGKWPRPWHLPQ